MFRIVIKDLFVLLFMFEGLLVVVLELTVAIVKATFVVVPLAVQ